MKIKKVFVSGASKGIGKAIAKSFDAFEYEVIVCARGEDALCEFKEEFKKAKLIYRCLDLAEKADVMELKDFFIVHGFPDIVIANMNYSRPYLKLEKYNGASDFFVGIEAHLSYLVEILPGTLAHQRKQKFGRWIGISSIVSELKGIEGMGFYLMQKRMLESFFDSLVLELNSNFITANVLQLGLFESDRVKSQNNYSKMESFNLLQRPGNLKEVVGIVKFLVSEDSSFIIGEKIKVDGGASLTWHFKQLFKK